ncbi:MAG: hypothetical protein SCH71_07220 [Desulfobulbaceae bacterium]|nr:hypothetical protein [Desulfobulbaceae bacterium]
MKPAPFKTILLLLAALMLNCTALSGVGQGATDDWQLHEIEITPSGTMQITSGDPYIIFSETDQQVCSPSGVHFVIRFERMPRKPMYMEMFWGSATELFGEDRKVFFILHPDPEKDTVDFVVPLTQQAGYRQIRLDFPGDIDTPFMVEKYEIVPAGEFPEEAVVVESYSRLAEAEVRNPAILIPFVIRAIRHGAGRLAHDPAFLIFWLLLIVALLASHRAVLRSAGQPEDGCSSR